MFKKLNFLYELLNFLKNTIEKRYRITKFKKKWARILIRSFLEKLDYKFETFFANYSLVVFVEFVVKQEVSFYVDLGFLKGLSLEWENT